jgi:uncharacterized membrane protein
MKMKKFIISAVSALVTMLVIDFVWLVVISKDFYADNIGHLTANSPNLVPALIFYLIYVTALTILVVLPSLDKQDRYLKVFGLGLLLGLLAYGTYDLTNQAVLKDWPIIVTVVDMLWGMLLTGTVTLVAYFSTKKLAN